MLFGPKHILRERNSLGSFLNPYTFVQRRIVVVIQFSKCLLSTCQRPHMTPGTEKIVFSKNNPCSQGADNWNHLTEQIAFWWLVLIGEHHSQLWIPALKEHSTFEHTF